MIFDMLNYCSMLDKYNVSIIYSGPLWMGGIENLGTTIRKRLERDAIPISISQSVFSVFIEQMNNMLMYSAEREQFGIEDGEGITAPRGTFVLGVQEETYFIQCGNAIKNEKIEKLRSRIDHLNSLDKVGLRKYYKEQIKKSNDNPESKGAGLGLIEIARRTSSSIEYNFTPLDNEYSFYTLYAEISQGGSKNAV